MADVLKRSIRARVLLERDGRTHHDQTYYSEDQPYYESTHQRIKLATDMSSPQEIDLSGVGVAPGTNATAGSLYLETNRVVLVAVDDNTKLWPLAEHGAVLLVGSFTHLYVQNESTTNVATVDLVVTD